MTSDTRSATVADIAAACGVELAHAPVETVPVDHYRERGDAVCRECGRAADPPFLVVARFDDESPQCHECFADRLPIGEPQATVGALAAAGWRVAELQQEFTPLGRHAPDAPALLRDVRRTL